MRPPASRLERVEAWGMSSASAAYVYRPTSIEGILEALKEAEKCSIHAAFKGGGNSYGDAFQCAEGVVIDLSRMTRILSWDPATGVLECEPGVTIRAAWQHTLPDGWWPPVVSGTSFTTLGGALSANIHGKNSFHAGPIGEHVLEFDLLTVTRELLRCSPTENSDVFFAAIGGFGLLGAIVRIAIQMHKVHSGLLEVEAFRTRNWQSTFQVFENYEKMADYLVGWVDCFAGGRSAGRSLIHSARYLKPGEDAHPEESLRVSAQALPDTVMGWVARSRMHKLMRPFVRPLGMRLVNAMKYAMSRREHGTRVRQPLAKFNFLLDSAPNWKLAYQPGSLIQHQSFIPKNEAMTVFEKIISLSQGRGLVPFLGVLKRHRPDRFLLSHAVDGYSLALDYRKTRSNAEDLAALIRVLDDVVLESGGRFYLAKDSTLTPGSASRIWPQETVEKFVELKRRLDPSGLLQTEQSKRVFGDFARLSWDERPQVESP